MSDTHNDRHGAAPEQWDGLAYLAGLREDLLPVVSNPDAVISPQSSMKGLGKTPSRYNGQREVVGIADWTNKYTVPDAISRWQTEPDYGICVQTRRVRALDVDITDYQQAARVLAVVQDHLSEALPSRYRDNSAKFLLAFQLPGEFTKRVIRTESGIIEFLATGQQFVAYGRHTSGVPYAWAWQDGKHAPREYYFPTLDPDVFEVLWDALQAEFGIEEDTRAPPSVKLDKLREALANDPVAQHLLEGGHVLKEERDGRLHIECPFSEEHTADTGIASTTYWPAHTGGYERGHFKCLHAHCEGRTDAQFLDKLEYKDEALIEKFAALSSEYTVPHQSDDAPPTSSEESISAGFDAIPASEDPVPVKAKDVPRFQGQWADEYIKRPLSGYHIKRVLPKAAVGILYGESTAGKTFVALDMAMSIARGEDWRDHRVKQGAVGFVAAEAAEGISLRIQAYRRFHELDGQLNLWVCPWAPNMLDAQEALDLSKAILAAGKARGHKLEVLFVDTLAAVNQGGNENDSSDMSTLIRNCQLVNLATGVTVVLIHHSGKDAVKGARGSSAIKGAADFQIAVYRDREADLRQVFIEKMKDGQDGARYYFDLGVVPIGIDEDDEVITSCVCQPVDAPAGGDGLPAITGTYQVAFMNALKLIGESQSDGIELDGVLEEAKHGLPRGDGADRRRSYLMRAAANLAQKGFFILEDGIITLGQIEKE